MTARGSWALLAGAPLLSACGGGAPLLHGAHTLPEGEVTFAAGTSGHFMLGDLANAEDALEDAGSDPSGATTDAEKTRFARGALARFAVSPGVAPFVAGRVGLGSNNEAGLTYTARTLRLDGRHAFEWDSVAISLGLAAIGALPRVGDRPDADIEGARGGGLRSTELVSPRGYGFEIPALIGYRSAAGVVKAWAGMRAGIERDGYDITVVEAPDNAWKSTANATRWWAGGLLGFSVGLDPVEVRAELDVAYESAHGDLVTGPATQAAEVSGVTLTPAMAISAKF